MRTTVNIDEHLLADAKAVAVRTRRSLGDVVNDALRVMLAEQRDGPVTERPRVKITTCGGSGLQPGVDLEDKEAMAELLGDNRPFFGGE